MNTLTNAAGYARISASGLDARFETSGGRRADKAAISTSINAGMRLSVRTAACSTGQVSNIPALFLPIQGQEWRGIPTQGGH